eukprot:TRINITY_DN248_c0_g1_i1.p1 TRINITY_DN248_c0_g1~~TRINITY_DN248_c0_g1_i1.p1  ORF type:complete len:183 (+),score=3.24 TRINITY_DN248_c0_g1_i1:44-592(+)
MFQPYGVEVQLMTPHANLHGMHGEWARWPSPRWVQPPSFILHNHWFFRSVLDYRYPIHDFANHGPFVGGVSINTPALWSYKRGGLFGFFFNGPFQVRQSRNYFKILLPIGFIPVVARWFTYSENDLFTDLADAPNGGWERGIRGELRKAYMNTNMDPPMAVLRSNIKVAKDRAKDIWPDPTA